MFKNLGKILTEVIAESNILFVPIRSRLFYVVGPQITWLRFRQIYGDYDFWCKEYDYSCVY